MLRALARAAADQLKPPMLVLALLPIVVAVLAWVVVFAIWGGGFIDWLGAVVMDSAIGRLIAGWLMAAGLEGLEGWVRTGVPAFIAVALGAAGTFATALVIIGVVAMPVVLRFVGASRHPGLARHGDGAWLPSLANGTLAALAYGALWVVTLPLWLVPPLMVVVPWLLSGWLIARTFGFDALADHASAAERRHLLRRHRAPLLLLGLACAGLGVIPLLLPFVPVYASLAFAHYLLDALAEARGASHPPGAPHPPGALNPPGAPTA